MTDDRNKAPLPSISEKSEGRKPAIQQKGGAPASLPSRREGFSKSMKKFNKEHCNNRFGK